MDAVQEAAVTDILDRVKVVLGVQDDDLSDSDTETKLVDDVEAALADIKRTTGGNWLTGDVPTIKLFNVPPSSLRNIDDLQMDPAPVVSLYGDELTVDEDYVLLLNREQTAYYQIKRLVGGVAALWNTGHEGEDSSNAIEINGLWASTLASRADFLRRWETLAVAYARRRQNGYADSAGSVELGFSDSTGTGENLSAIGAGYSRRTPRQIEAVGI